MSNVVIDKQKIDILANAISAKSGEPVTMTLAEMVEAVDGIETGGGEPNLQAKSYTVDSAGTESITADSGYEGLSSVSVSVPQIIVDYSGIYGQYKTVSGNRKWEVNGWVDGHGWLDNGDGIATEHYVYDAVPKNTTVTPTTSSQTIGGANYMMEGAVTVSAMPSGTAGTPTATKGTVSNHSVSVTPSVTNQTGYITGSTKTGTAVSVAASELVSGNLPITQNGTGIDVTNYATVSVDVQGGGSSGMQIATKTATPSSASASISFTGLSGEPTSFVVTTDSELATGASPYKTATVVFDGANVIGQYITNTNNAQVTYDSSGYSKSYSNGTLTITGTNANFQENQYTLVYTYGGSSANLGTADVQVGSGATSITFTGLEEEPDYFSLAFKSNFGTSSGYQRVITVVYDGTSTYGLEMDSSAKYSNAHFSYTYNSGSLVISSSGTNAGGYFHQPGYYQLTYGIGGEAPELEAEPLSVTQNGTYTAPRGKAYTPVTVNVSGGGGVNIATATTTNSSNQNTSISFTLPSGRTPKAFFCRLTSQIARNSSNRYYYVFDMRWDGSSTGGVEGNTFYMYSGTLTNVTSGYSYSQSGTTFSLSSSGSRSASPGSFYNGDYELVYVY